MSIVYGMREETYCLEGHSRVAYGIAVYAYTEEEGSATVLFSVGDITSNKEKLSHFIDDCNRLGLSALHLCDAIEDFLAD